MQYFILIFYEIACYLQRIYDRIPPEHYKLYCKLYNITKKDYIRLAKPIH